MTRDELAARINRNLNSSGVFYTPDDINDSIQDGYDEVTAFCGTIEKAVSLPFIANLTYYDFATLISDFVGVVAIWNTTTKRWLFPISERKLDQERDNWEIATGTPEYFYPVNYRYVAIYKKPSAAGYGNMYVFYRAAAPTLSGNTTPLLPVEFVDILENYTTADMLEQQREWVKATEEQKEYIQTLQLLKTHVMQHRIPARVHTLVRG